MQLKLSLSKTTTIYSNSFKVNFIQSSNNWQYWNICFENVVNRPENVKKNHYPAERKCIIYKEVRVGANSEARASLLCFV